MNAVGTLPAGRWACAAARLFDGEQVLEEMAIVIDGDRIADILPAAQLPADIFRLSQRDGTVLPGLIDVHVHFTTWQGPLYLAWGVTTVRDVGNDPHWILAQRAAAPAQPWPRLNCVGPMHDGPQPHWPFCRACADLAAACRAVAETAALGVDGIKLYPGIPTDWLPAILSEVRKTGLPVMMHCAEMVAACELGVDECFHLDGLLDTLWPDRPGGWLEVWGHADFPDDHPRLRETADRIAASGAIVTPTLFYWDFAHAFRAAATLPPASASIPARNLQWLRGFRNHHVDAAAAAIWRRARDRAVAFTGLLVDRDVPLLPGTDEPWGVLPPGLSLWRELSLLVAAGMCPRSALRAATADAAARLRLAKRGRLRRGWLADLVLVAGDPTTALPEQPQITAVVRDGRIFEPAQLMPLVDTYAQAIDDEPIGRAFSQMAGKG